MQKWWQVFRFDLLRQGRRRAYLFTTFGIPLIAVALLLGYQAIQDYNARRAAEAPVEEGADEDEADVMLVGYVDESGLFPSPGMFGATLHLYNSEDEALAALENGDVSTVFVISPDYLETGAVTRYMDTFSLEVLNLDGFFRSFLLQALLQESDIDRSLVQRLQSGLVITEHHVDTAGQASVTQSEGASLALVYVFALLLAFATFFAGGYLMSSVIEEKETRMVEIILSTIKPLPLLVGKVLAAGLLGLTQIVIWIATAIFVLDRLANIIPALGAIVVPPGTLLWVTLYFLLGFLFFAGVYAAIGAVSTSMREGPQFAVIVTLPAMLPFYFLFIFTETPNAALPVILSLFPVTAPLAMVQRLVLTDVPLIEMVISLGLLAVAAVGTVWLAGRVFRVNTLLAGQLPKLRDFVRIVREG